MNVHKINATPTTEWLVIRINYAEPSEEFLAKSLKPFVNTLVKGGIVERYFWQRGTERGDHILLTMRGDNRKLHELILPNFAEHFFRYVEDKPSYRQNDRPNFETNNSIQTQVYKPDTEGGGGIVGLPIFERYKQASSEAVLAFMESNDHNWTITEAATTAMKLHLGFCDAANMKVGDAMDFFEHCLVQSSNERFSVQFLEYVYQRWQKELNDFVEKIWESLKKGALFKEKHYNKWLENCYYTAEDVKITYRSKNGKDPFLEDLNGIFARYQKATNQQLNLTDRQTAVMYYVTLRALEEVVLPKILENN